ncbi:hypothetical protein D3C75_575190 [compost metagenome]
MEKTTLIGLNEHDETITLQLDRGTVCIAQDGTCYISTEYTGQHVNLFDDIKHSTSGNTVSGLLDTMSFQQATAFDKKSEIANYLYILFEAQKSGHDVHMEISDALKQYKVEAGI